MNLRQEIEARIGAIISDEIRIALDEVYSAGHDAAFECGKLLMSIEREDEIEKIVNEKMTMDNWEKWEAIGMACGYIVQKMGKSQRLELAEILMDPRLSEKLRRVVKGAYRRVL